MALNGNGAISTLIRRNDVSEAHRSPISFTETPPSKRIRHLSLVLGRSSNGDYNKFYSKSDDQWISIGENVSFGLNGDDCFQIGLVERIQMIIDIVTITIRLYKECEPSTFRPLSKICKRRLLDTLENPLVIRLNDDNVYVSLFSIQPDFVDGGDFDCPFMDILN